MLHICWKCPEFGSLGGWKPISRAPQGLLWLYIVLKLHVISSPRKKKGNAQDCKSSYSCILKFNVDEASKGNPGASGIRGVLKNDSFSVIGCF